MSETTFEIEHYLTEIKVGPYRGHKPWKLDANRSIYFKAGDTRKYEGEPRYVYTGSVGKLRRTVEFAEDNSYRNPFEIRYGTLASGAIVVHHDVDNEAHGKQLTPFLRNAQSYALKFTPPTEEPWPYLDLDVYKGFDRGNRNAHFHVTDPNQEEFGVTRHYRKMTYVLDLSEFKESDPPFRQPAGSHPRLWHTPKDLRHACDKRAASVLQNPERHQKNLIASDPKQSKPDEWIWTWELDSVTRGIVDVIWEDFLIPPYDVFVSHASEDKKFVLSLVKKLKAAGLEVWYDDDELTIGDELTQNIVRGIAFSLTGVVVLSPRFFDRKKTWTKQELEMISALDDDTKVILPVLHEMSLDDLRNENRELAELVGAKTENGIGKVAEAIVREVEAIQAQKKVQKKATRKRAQKVAKR